MSRQQRIEDIERRVAQSVTALEAASRPFTSPNVPDGAWVTMITPFTETKSIDWVGVHDLVEFYIQAGIAGIFAVCQSSEMYQLSNSERLKLAQEVVNKAAGRVPIIAGGTFEGSFQDMANFTKEMYKTGVEAVVVIASMMAGENDGEDVWRANVQKYMDASGDVPLGIYECPKPYHRLLSADTLRWVAGTGRFFTFKDTCCSIDGIHKKIDALKSVKDTKFKFFNANMATLLDSIQYGGSGFCGIAANCYPGLIAWLCAHPDKAQALQCFLSIAELTVATKYPQSAKTYLKLNEPAFEPIATVCRICDFAFNEEEIIRIRHLKGAVSAQEQLLK